MDKKRTTPLEKMGSESVDLTSLLNKHICKHDEYCGVKKGLSKEHCSQDYAENCQTAKYYTKYGDNPLGIGAVVNVESSGNSTKA